MIRNTGDTPYPGMSLSEALDAVASGYRMDPPPGMPRGLCDTLKKCCLAVRAASSHANRDYPVPA